MKTIGKQREYVRAALEKIVRRPGPPRKDGQDSWSANMRMLLYALVTYGLDRADDPTAFGVRGTYDDCLYYWITTEEVLTRVWRKKGSVPAELAPHAKFYEQYKGRPGKKVGVAKTIADNFRQLVAIAGTDKTPIRIIVGSEERPSKEGLIIEVRQRSMPREVHAPRQVFRLPTAPRRELTDKQRKNVASAIRLAVVQMSEAQLADAAAEVFAIVERANPHIRADLHDIAPQSVLEKNSEVTAAMVYQLIDDLLGSVNGAKIRSSPTTRDLVREFSEAAWKAVHTLAEEQISVYMESIFGKESLEGLRWTGELADIPAGSGGRTTVDEESTNGLVLIAVYLTGVFVGQGYAPTSKFWGSLKLCLARKPDQFKTNFLRSVREELEVQFQERIKPIMPPVPRGRDRSR